MSNRFFITGTGTGIGKTVVAAIVTQHLGADYWKPVQAGYDTGTDSEDVKEWLAGTKITVHPELYKLKLAASPHIAAREENIMIDLDDIVRNIPASDNLVIEGAGGLMVPLNDDQFVADLIKALDARVILVSKNELGSINHSLLTAAMCRQRGLDVAGWIFNGHYLDYEEEIVRWSGFPRLGSVPHTESIDQTFIRAQALRINMHS